MKSRIGLLLLSLLLALSFTSVAAPGKQIYELHCYQCHGYSGDGRTVAAGSLQPPPRDFSAASSQELSRDDILATLRRGRPGTAMVSFASVLSADELEAVANYVSRSLVGRRRVAGYHTTENGWPHHERYAAAYPYVLADRDAQSKASPPDNGSAEGLRLFQSACVTCHAPAGAQNVVWRARAVSYPRRAGFKVDAVTGATPFARHDRFDPPGDLTTREQLGQKLFLKNCAFCHAADGTGRNWIGAFLERAPRDLTGDSVAGMSDEALFRAIKRGVAQTSMPAWETVLSDQEIWLIVGYMRKVYGPR